MELLEVRSGRASPTSVVDDESKWAALIVQYVAKEVCTKMARPSQESWQMLKKVWSILAEGDEGDVGDASVEQ